MTENLSNKASWLLFIPIALVGFIIGVDLLGAGLALTPMSRQFSVHLSMLQWFISAFGIGNAAFLVTAGNLADRYGPRQMFLNGILVFTLSSVMIAVAHNFYWAIGWRFIQGASCGVMGSSSVAIMNIAYPVEQRTKWMGGMIGASGIGMALGPIIGGILIHYWSWRALFLINLPIGLLTLWLGIIYVKAQTSYKATRLDIIGIILFTLMIGLFATFISQGQAWGWSSHTSLGVIVASLLLLGIFLYYESRLEAPMLQLALFKTKNFLAGSCLGTTLYFGLTAWIFSFSIFYQHALNLSALDTGLHLTPFAIALLIGSTTIQHIRRYISNIKHILYYAAIMNILGFTTLAIAPLQSFLWVCLGSGLAGFGFLFMNANTITMATQYLAPQLMGIGSGTCLMTRWIGGSLGAAISASVILIRIQEKLVHSSQLFPQHAQAFKNLSHQGLMSGAHIHHLFLKHVFISAMQSGVHAAMACLALLNVINLLYIWKGLQVK